MMAIYHSPTVLFYVHQFYQIDKYAFDSYIHYQNGKDALQYIDQYLLLI